MIILACETSTLLGSVAVLKDQAVVAYKDSVRQGSHSDVLNVFVDSVLTEAKLNLRDIDLFATGVGPGSFTGIRISLNSIKTFAFCYNKPCIGIDSLLNLAHHAAKQPIQDKPIVSMINAYKNMVYVATYRKQNGTLAIIKEPAVIRVQNLKTYFETPSYVFGDGYQAYKAYFDQNLSHLIERTDDSSFDEPHAGVLGELAWLKRDQFALKWNELLPLYLRESEAEENVKGIKYQPLF